MVHLWLKVLMTKFSLQSHAALSAAHGSHHRSMVRWLTPHTLVRWLWTESHTQKLFISLSSTKPFALCAKRKLWSVRNTSFSSALFFTIQIGLASFSVYVGAQ